MVIQKASINKSQLVEAISEETTFSKRDVVRVIGSLTKIIEKTLKKGGKVSIAGFGAFTLSSRPERNGINPTNKQKIKLAAVTLPKFKAGKHLKEQVRNVKVAQK